MMLALVGVGLLIATLAAHVDSSGETYGVPLWAVLVLGLAGAVPVVGVIAAERELDGAASPRAGGMARLAGLLTLLLVLPVLGWAFFWGGVGAS